MSGRNVFFTTLIMAFVAAAAALWLVRSGLGAAAQSCLGGSMLLMAAGTLLALKVSAEECRRLVARAETFLNTDDAGDRVKGVVEEPAAPLDRAVHSLGQALRKAKVEAKLSSEKMKSQIRQAEEAAAQAAEASNMAERVRGESMRAAADKLQDMVGRIRKSSASLVALVNKAAKGADLQKGRLDETATAMDEMNLAILDIARNVSQAAQSVDSAKERAVASASIAEGAIEAIGRVNEAASGLKRNMSGLGDQARSIDKIINVITDIADQTNLLALNAAIEAARAGEAGRGFAVVADEVRKLAEKTMQATKEVGDAIRSIQEAVLDNIGQMDQAVAQTDEAANKARRSGEAVRDITAHVEENADKIRSIATASEEQSASSEHISKAIDQVNDVAGEIAAGIHESERALAELSSLTADLGVLIQDMNSDKGDALVTWNSDLVVNVALIDEQHQKLIQLINDLYTAMKVGKSASILERLLTDLAEYTVYHFDTEEKLFDQFGYAETASHKKVHAELKAQVVDFLTKLRTGQASVSMDLLHFLRDWVVNHICRTDRRYSQFFHDCGLA